MDIIRFRKLNDSINDYELMFKWCQDKDIYEWFEQRPLTFDEIKNKYKKKIDEGKQELLIININQNDIGFVQIYKYENEVDTYEFDVFIGNKNYRHKGYGVKIINEINNYISANYNTKAIILRPFKRNINAINCYKKCGYKLIKEYNDKNTIGEDEIVCLLINKR